jgi:hypothetical protein
MVDTEKGSIGESHLPHMASIGPGTRPAGPYAFVPPEDDDPFNFDTHDLDKVQRQLQQRHVQMIAVGEYVAPWRMPS